MFDLDIFSSLEKKIVFKATQSKLPITVNFELTPCCNLNCDMCYIKLSSQEQSKHGSLLTLKDWIVIAESLKQKGVLFILLTGGEPLLYPNFIELYTELKKLGFIITINTNGTLITENISKLFGQLKPRRVNVTLYGNNSDTYAKLCHNKYGYENCIRGIKLLKEHNVDVKLNVSVVQKNLNDYSSFFSLAKKLDIPLEVNSYMFPCLRSTCATTRSILKERLAPREAAQTEIEYLKYKKGNQYPTYIRNFKEWMGVGISDSLPLGLDCRAGKSSCWINWQGKMSPCVAMEQPSISLREYSVDEAWNFIVDESQKLEKHTECAGCKLRPICDVCYAAACHEKKMVGNLSHLCEIAEWKKRYLLEE